MLACGEGEHIGMDIILWIQVTQFDVGVSLQHISIEACFLCILYNPCMSLFNSIHFLPLFLLASSKLHDTLQNITSQYYVACVSTHNTILVKKDLELGG